MREGFTSMIHDPLFDDPAAHTTLLAPIPEAELLWRMQRFPAHTCGGAEVVRVPNPTRSQLTHLLRQYHFATYIRDTEAAEAARDILVPASLHVVFAAVRRYRVPSALFEDAVSVGYLSLYHTIEKFDFRRTSDFFRYAFRGACFAIRTYYRRECAERRRTRSYSADTAMLGPASGVEKLPQSADNINEQMELRHFVRTWVHALPPEERAVVTQLWWEGESVAEQARRTGENPRVLRGRKAASCRKLRKGMERVYDDYV